MPELRATHRDPLVWPGDPVPVPPVPVWDIRVHEEHWVELVGAPRQVELPADFYLKEMSARRPQTREQVVDFVAQWGRVADLDWRDRPLGEVWMRQIAEQNALADGRLPRGKFLNLERMRIAEKVGLSTAHAYAMKQRVVHIAEIEDRFEAANWMAGRFTERQDGVERDQVIWDLFAEQLNAALSAFQVRINIGGARSVVLPELTAYSVSALQMANDLATRAVLRRCENEVCPNVFTRQRGRAEHGQHRTVGKLKYCDKYCAKAQGERERRRKARGAAQ